jgi:hypothetical protein
MSRLPHPIAPPARRRAGRVTAALAAAALSALVLAGCSLQQPTDGSSSTMMPAPAPALPDAPVEMLPGDAANEEAGRDVAGSDAEASDRSVITTGWVSVTVGDPIAAADDVAEVATAAGGRVDGRTETPGTDSQQATAQLTLRIPADELDGVIDELRALGTVTSVSVNASDVTQQRQDLDARIEALRTSVDRLSELLAQATSVTDIVAIESELTTRQAELDSLTQQRDWLVDQVDYSTLSVDLVTEAAAPDPRPDDFWGGVVAGWNALWSFLGGLVVALGVLLPWIVVLAVIGGIVLAVVLLATRGARRRAAAGAPQPPSPSAAPGSATPPHEERTEA